MAVYEYEHVKKGCSLGQVFDYEQPMSEAALRVCPECGREVRRLIPSRINISSPKSNAELKNLGFTKLVRRDKGVYENVTAGHDEKRILEAGDSEPVHIHRHKK